ncbi:MAG: IS1182 family transposase [Gammaproteobacteria bacterium]
MARYKDYCYAQTKLLPISFSHQILPGTFEYTLSYLIEHEVDLSPFEDRYQNDETGAPAYDPALLLKIILYAYSRGIVSSRRIERCCQENVIFMALSADTQPHFTTIAEFVAVNTEAVTALFRDVLLICDELGLIGRELFAIDGCKLPSNASKEWSGTKADLRKKKQKMAQAVRYLLKRHREMDLKGGQEDPRIERERQQLKTLRAKIRKLKRWLDDNDDKPGKSGRPKQSNLTDNESAKMKSSHGVIQGYDGVAMVDAKHQVVVEAQAFGEAQEHDLLAPMIEATRANFQAIARDQDVFEHARLTADAGFHTEQNMKRLFEEGVDGYVADNLFRKRDPRFNTAARHKPNKAKQSKRFGPRDFIYDQDTQTCICPAGKRLYLKQRHVIIRGYQAICFMGPKRDCLPCHLRQRCLQDPHQKTTRQVYFFAGRAKDAPETYTAKMKRKIDSLAGRHIYSYRLATAEPVFANITHALGLKRFTLRGQRKVNGQWRLFCMVHNLLKIHRYAPGFT